MTDRAQHVDEARFGLLADFRLLVLLFVVFRLGLGIVYQPALFERYTAAGEEQLIERGLSTFGDAQYYYELAALTDHSVWLYRDLWFEFPPVWSLVFVGLYRVMALFGSVAYSPWATALGLLMTLCEAGNLFLLRCLARYLHGEHVALALVWVYAVLVVPVIMPWWNFEPLVVFLLLLALWGLLAAQRTRSALAVAFGILTKYLAVLVLPAVWRFRSIRYAGRYTIIALGIPLMVLGLLVAWGGETARVSLAAQANKASHQTVWALLDGNHSTGQFPRVGRHRDPDAAIERNGNPPVIPGWLRLIPFAVIGGWVYVHTHRRDDRGLVAFVTLTLLLFFLWAQGWSPQWVLTLTPLILLSFPSRSGVLLCAVLGFISLLEYPTLFGRMIESGDRVPGDLRLLFVMLILLRTMLLAGLGMALAAQLVGTRQHGDA